MICDLVTRLGESQAVENKEEGKVKEGWESSAGSLRQANAGGVSHTHLAQVGQYSPEQASTAQSRPVAMCTGAQGRQVGILLPYSCLCNATEQIHALSYVVLRASW